MDNTDKEKLLESLRLTLAGEERALEYADGAAYSQSKIRIAELKARIAALEGAKEEK